MEIDNITNAANSDPLTTALERVLGEALERFVAEAKARTENSDVEEAKKMAIAFMATYDLFVEFDALDAPLTVFFGEFRNTFNNL